MHETHWKCNEHKLEDVREEVAGVLLSGLSGVHDKACHWHLIYIRVLVIMTQKLGHLDGVGEKCLCRHSRPEWQMLQHLCSCLPLYSHNDSGSSRLTLDLRWLEGEAGLSSGSGLNSIHHLLHNTKQSCL